MYAHFTNTKYEILNHDLNTSDHLAINLLFECEIDELTRSNNKTR